MNLTPESSVVKFTDYISQHRLFRNLVTFNLQIPSLMIGQQKTPADYPKLPRSHYRNKDDTPSEPTRFPNELLALRGLQCLEECILRTSSVPGMVVTKNFWFMRRKIDSHTVSFLPAKKKRISRKLKRMKWDKKSTFKPNTTDDSDDVKGEEDDDEEQEKEEGWEKEEIFWPKLTIFHIHYLTCPSTDTVKLVEDFEWIRPGVDFSFQRCASLT
jgi:hypothetical protein